MKQKLHSFVITIRTDKPCNKSVALREVRDCIHGDFYCSPRDDDDPDGFKVSSFASLPRKPR